MLVTNHNSLCLDNISHFFSDFLINVLFFINFLLGHDYFVKTNTQLQDIPQSFVRNSIQMDIKIHHGFAS